MDGGIICKFTFRCERKWDELKAIDGNEKARFCTTCESPVYMTTTYDELAANVAAKRCVAIRATATSGEESDLLTNPSDPGELMGYVEPQSLGPRFDPVLKSNVSRLLRNQVISEKLRRNNIFLTGDLVQLSSSNLLNDFSLTVPEIDKLKESLALHDLTIDMKIQDWDKLPQSYRLRARNDDAKDDWSIDDLL